MCSCAGVEDHHETAGVLAAQNIPALTTPLQPGSSFPLASTSTVIPATSSPCGTTVTPPRADLNSELGD